MSEFTFHLNCFERFSYRLVDIFLISNWKGCFSTTFYIIKVIEHCHKPEAERKRSDEMHMWLLLLWVAGHTVDPGLGTSFKDISLTFDQTEGLLSTRLKCTISN